MMLGMAQNSPIQIAALEKELEVLKSRHQGEIGKSPSTA